MILLKNGHVVDPAQNLNGTADILIEGQTIQAVGQNLEAPGAQVIDLQGKVVMPGFIDLHVHLREPGREDKETVLTGTQAAIHGGFTSIACMPNTTPVADNEAIIESVLYKAHKAQLADVYPIACITKGQKGEELTEMLLLRKAGAAAFSDDGRTVQHSGVMRRAMDYSKALDGLLISHCEDEDLLGSGVMNEGIVSTELGLGGIPNEVEDLIIARDLMLAKLTGCRIHIAHVSTAGGVELIAKAKAEGVRVTAEATPHHLCLTEEAVRGYDTNTKVNPPLRTEADRTALWQALKAGVIDCVSTDHAPHTIQDKEVEYVYAANGISGLETAAPLIWTNFVATGLMTVEDMARVMSQRPAEILRIEKGTLQAGRMADIVVLDPDTEKAVDNGQFYSKGKNTPFQGMQLKGWPELVVKGGRIVLEQGVLC